MGMSPIREGLVIGTEDHFVAGLLQPQAQAASSAEEVGGQSLALSPQSLGVPKKCFDVLSMVAMRWEINEWATDQPDTITAALAGFLCFGRHQATLTGRTDTALTGLGRAQAHSASASWFLNKRRPLVLRTRRSHLASG